VRYWKATKKEEPKDAKDTERKAALQDIADRLGQIKTL